MISNARPAWWTVILLGLAGVAGAIGCTSAVEDPTLRTAAVSSPSAVTVDDFSTADVSTFSRAGAALSVGSVAVGVGEAVVRRNLPSVRWGHSVVAHGGALYAIGGCAGVCGTAGVTPLASIARARIAEDGSLEEWTDAGALPQPRALAAAVVSGGRLYVAGGIDATNAPSDVVWVADLREGAALTWRTLTPLLSGPLQRHALVAASGRLYTIGGHVGGSAYPGVQAAPINADGSLGAWSDLGSLPGELEDVAAAVHGGRLYAVGRASSEVVTARVEVDGKLSPWRRAGAVRPRSNPSLLAHAGALYVLGGLPQGAPGAELVETAVIDPRGLVSRWRPSAGEARHGQGAALARGAIYVVGGCVQTTCAASDRDTTRSFALSNQPPSHVDHLLGGWRAEPALPQPVFGPVGGTVGNAVVVTGGDFNAVPTDATWIAFPSETGELNAWDAGTALLEDPRVGHAAASDGAAVYVTGGTTNYTEVSTGNAIGRLDPLGQVEWTAATPLTTVRNDHASAILGTHLFVAGGRESAAAASLPNSTVASAPLADDGTTGSWTSQTEMPEALLDHTLVGAAGFAIVIGGTAGVTTSDKVYLSAESGGALGTWAHVATLPQPRRRHTAHALGDQLFVIGGCDTGCDTTPQDVLGTVLGAKVLPDGGIEPWTSTASDLPARADHASTIAAGTLYVIAGRPTNAQATDLVHSAPIITGDRSARLSLMVDLGGESTVQSISFDAEDFADAGVRLVTRTAPESGVFGNAQPWAPVPLNGTESPLDAGIGRFLWLEADVVAPSEGVTTLRSVTIGHDRCAAVSCAETECAHAGSCDPATGACTRAPKPDGEPCAGGLCRAGLCEAPLTADGGAPAPGAIGDPYETLGCHCSSGPAPWLGALIALIAWARGRRRGTS